MGCCRKDAGLRVRASASAVPNTLVALDLAPKGATTNNLKYSSDCANGAN
jgi:hypothetical protein